MTTVSGHDFSTPPKDERQWSRRILACLQDNRVQPVYVDLTMIYLWFTYDFTMIYRPNYGFTGRRGLNQDLLKPPLLSASHSLSENRAPKSHGVSSASQFLMTIICGIAQVFRQIHMNPIEVMAVPCLSNIFMASRQWVARQKNARIVPLAMRQRYKPATNFRVCVCVKKNMQFPHPSLKTTI